jgi:hypothetical protein
MRAMGGATKPPARCCSKSHRICQIRPSTKPIAIATEIPAENAHHVHVPRELRRRALHALRREFPDHDWSTAKPGAQIALSGPDTFARVMRALTGIFLRGERGDNDGNG